MADEAAERPMTTPAGEVTITLTAKQASTLWWLLEGTRGATEDRGLDKMCKDVARKLEKVGVQKDVECQRQEKR